MTSFAKLFLVVSNPEQLTHGSRPLCGPVEHNTIISNNTTTGWQLHDASGEVHAPHACIQIIDNRYVLVDLCGHTYINHHRDPLGKMHVVALNDSDNIRIGKYQIKALIDRAGMTAIANNAMFSRKLGASVVVARRGGASHTFASLNNFFFISQMIVPGSNYWNMGFGREKGDVEKDEEAQGTMRTLGQNMAWLLKQIQ